MKTLVAILSARASAILIALSVTACGGKSGVNEQNFAVAISRHLDQKGALCLQFPEWPASYSDLLLSLSQQTPDGVAARMAALQEVGLVQVYDTETDARGYRGQPTGAKRTISHYSLTDKSKPFQRAREVKRLTAGGASKVQLTDLCWGKKVFDKIQKWEGPLRFGEYQEANVHYLYHVEGVASWATNPEILKAFPVIRETLDGVGKRSSQISVALTSVGWEVPDSEN